MNCQYEGNCLIYWKYRHICPEDEEKCKVIRLDDVRNIDESMLEGDIYVAELQVRFVDLIKSMRIE